MGSRLIVYVGIYALIYQHTILGEGIVSRDGLPRGVLPSGILKTRKNVQALKFPARLKYMFVVEAINNTKVFSLKTEPD